MKNILNILAAMGLLLLIGCFNFILPPDTPVGIHEDMAYVSVQFGIEARTVLPENPLTFNHWHLEFTPLNGTAVIVSSKDEPPINLNAIPLTPGTYTLEAWVFHDNWNAQDANFKDVAIGTGDVTNINVNAGSTSPIPVTLNFKNTMPGDGTFEWDITSTFGDKIVGASITLEPLPSGTTITIPRTELTNTNGEMAGQRTSFSAGNYIATIRIQGFGIANATNALKTEIFQDVVHIIPGQKTTLEHTFTEGQSFRGFNGVWIATSDTPPADADALAAMTFLPMTENASNIGVFGGTVETGKYFFLAFGDIYPYALIRPSAATPLNNPTGNSAFNVLSYNEPFDSFGATAPLWHANVTGDYTVSFNTNTFTLTIVNSSAPTYAISVTDPAIASGATHTFTGATAGYTAITPTDFKIKNEGTGAMTDLDVALTAGTHFTLNITSLNATLAADGETTFSIKPNDGLTANTYTDTVTITDANLATDYTFYVSFEVTAGP